MSRMAKIAICVPEDLLAAVDRRRSRSGESRSAFFRRAVEALLVHDGERVQSKRYVQAYEIAPDSEDEVKAAHQAASIILAEQPWE